MCHTNCISIMLIYKIYIYTNTKDAEKNYSLKWSIVAKAKPYHPLAGRCRLCTREKTEISSHIEDPKCLNVRSELMSTCRHRRRWLLSSTPG